MAVEALSSATDTKKNPKVSSSHYKKSNRVMEWESYKMIICGDLVCEHRTGRVGKVVAISGEIVQSFYVEFGFGELSELKLIKKRDLHMSKLRRTNTNINDLEVKALWVRQRLWEMTMKLRRGHLPSCFSSVDILVALFYGGYFQYNSSNPKDPNRDRLIISKGHGAAVLYPILADLGFFDLDELNHYGEPGALLGVFADTEVPGIEAISDSLGHGLGIGVGMALAAKGILEYRVFVVLGDAECNEGSVWEAAAFAGHYKLNNLIAIVDDNKLGILGETVCNQSMYDRWQSFGWVVRQCDGHEISSLLGTYKDLRNSYGKPIVLLADTIKGKGVSFMEGRAEWHNRMPDKEQERQGRIDLGLEK